MLQAAALIALVLALARPERRDAAVPAPVSHIYVLDDAAPMSRPGRLAAAKRAILEDLAAARGENVGIVVSAPQPRVLAEGESAAAVERRLASLRSTQASGDLAGALALAAGMRRNPGDRITLVRAAEEPTPPVVNATRLAVRVIGAAGDPQIVRAAPRCGLGPPDRCDVLVSVRNAASSAVRERLTVVVGGRVVGTRTLRLAAGEVADETFTAPAGASRVELRLTGSHDRASVTLPRRSPTAVTVVAPSSRLGALERALGAIPGVTVTARTPADYRSVRADVLMFDGWLPPGPLAPAAGVLLVDPPRLPAGKLGPPLRDPTVSGTDDGSPLLEGVDLSSLVVDQNVRRIVAPAWMRPVVWAPGGPLLAAGDDGRRKLAVIAFDLDRSNLPSLPAFPVLVANLVSWLTTGTDTVEPAGPQVVDLAPVAADRIAPRHAWWPWAVGLGLVLLAAEWLYARGREFAR